MILEEKNELGDDRRISFLDCAENCIKDVMETFTVNVQNIVTPTLSNTLKQEVSMEKSFQNLTDVVAELIELKSSTRILIAKILFLVIQSGCDILKEIIVPQLD